jgi:putative oxidoreductase
VRSMAARAPEGAGSAPRVIERGGLAAGVSNLAALAGRLMLAVIFVQDGWMAITSYSGVQQYMESNGVSGQLLPLVIATELGGGLLVAFGLLSRIAAFGLAGFCLLTAFIFHHDLGDADQSIQFYKDIAIAGGFLMLVAFGPGAWSVDAWLRRRRV